MRQSLRKDQTLLADVWRLALPTLLEGLMMTLVQYVDTAMVGSLGANATAAVAVNAAPTWLLNGVLSGVGVGGTAIVARAIGPKNQREAEEAAWHALLCGIVVSALFALLALLVSGAFPLWMGAEAAVRPDATAYLRIIAIGFIPQYVGVVAAASLRGAGDMKTPMFYSILVNLLNVIGNYLLIYDSRWITFLGLRIHMPGAGLGVSGAAISTAISTALYGLLVVLHMRGRSSRLRLRRYPVRREMLGRIGKVGLPAAMERVAINAGQIVFARMVAGFGTASLAAHHLAVSIESLSYQPGYGVAQAATTLVGQSLGAGDTKRAEKAGLMSGYLGMAIMAVAGVLIALFRVPLMRLFTPDAEVVQIGASLLLICAGYQPFFAMSIVMTGALRGAGDTKVPFYISLFSMWGLRLVLAWVFAYGLGMGVRGAWLGMFADIFARGLLVYIRFRRGAWKRIQV